MGKQRRRSASFNREADQRLCFLYMDSMIPLLLKSEISSLLQTLRSPFVSDLVGNPEDGFSNDEAHIIAFFVTSLNACKGMYDVRDSILTSFLCNITEYLQGSVQCQRQ